jgi:calcineurin-like phosphoesterase family protein
MEYGIMNYYFVSDTHFGHRNVIKYSKRPFSSIEEHDEIIIQNWNKTIKRNDMVYFLGDFCMAGRQRTLDIRKRLNGAIFFIRGNHDKTAYQIRDTFQWFGDVKKIKIYDQEIFLSHYAHLTWNKMHYGCWMLFGHSHGGMNEWLSKNLLEARMLDVGVDTHNYVPYSFEEIKEHMDKKKGAWVDHHEPKNIERNDSQE